MTRWYQEKKSEHFYKQAKRVGYRARSAFKLKQIQNRFSIFSNGDVVLDLGAAPGGWSQAAKEYVGETGKVIGIDLLAIKPLDGILFFQGDVTEEETINEVKFESEIDCVDVIISDMSPDISGNYSMDQARSVWLCEKALCVAEKMLKNNGNFICKIFEGEDTKEFIDKLKGRFYKVKVFSPKASRKSSSEIYLVAKKFKR